MCLFLWFIVIVCVAVSPAPVQVVSLDRHGAAGLARREVKEKHQHAWARFFEEERWEKTAANDKA
jgi:hypothetical protein